MPKKWKKGMKDMKTEMKTTRKKKHKKRARERMMKDEVDDLKANLLKVTSGKVEKNQNSITQKARGTDIKARGTDIKARGGDTKARGGDTKTGSSDPNSTLAPETIVVPATLGRAPLQVSGKNLTKLSVGPNPKQNTNLSVGPNPKQNTNLSVGPNPKQNTNPKVRDLQKQKKPNQTQTSPPKSPTIRKPEQQDSVDTSANANHENIHQLKSHFEQTKQSWVDNANYEETNNQLKAIRNSLQTRQIENKFTLEVFETHARLALENNDLPEFERCLAQSLVLHRTLDIPDTVPNKSEFIAYNILYAIYKNDKIALSSQLKQLRNSKVLGQPGPIKHALDVIAAISSGSDLTHLYDTAPNMGEYILELLLVNSDEDEDEENENEDGENENDEDEENEEW